MAFFFMRKHINHLEFPHELPKCFLGFKCFIGNFPYLLCTKQISPETRENLPAWCRCVVNILNLVNRGWETRSMDIGYNVQVAQDTGDEISWQPLSLTALGSGHLLCGNCFLVQLFCSL